MKLSGVGLEPHECNSKFLTKRLGVDKACLICVGVVLGVIMLFVLIFFVRYGLDDDVALPILASVLGFGLIFGIPTFFLYREVREIQKELAKRCAKDENESLHIGEMTKKNTRRSLIAIVCFIVISVIIIVSVICGDSTSTSNIYDDDGNGRYDPEDVFGENYEAWLEYAD